MYNSGNSSKNVRGSNIIDGTVETVDIADDAVTVDKLANAINTDIATGVSGSITAGDALPKAGGTMTGLLTVPSLAVTGAATFIDAGAQGPNLSFENIGGSTKFRETTSGNFFYEAWAHYFSKSGGATTLTLTSSNNVEVNTGNLVIGTSGKGIDFSATAGTGTSEVLDDYEEGSYTVGFYDDASGGNTSSTTPTGYYTKIGNQVNVTFSASNINTGGLTSGNSAYISLPFTASSFTWGTGTLITDNVNFRSRDTLNAYVGNSATRCYIKASGQATSDAGIRWSEFVSGSSDIVSFSVTYTAA